MQARGTLPFGLPIEVLSDEKKISLQITGSENLVVNGDKIKLRELFMNLLDNAIRNTPQTGKINISIGRQDNYALVTVSDTGVGIPEEDIPYLFKRYSRVNQSHSRKDGGAGLGLAICKRIVDLHQGRIEVKSILGKGSTFSVFLPLIE